MMLWDLIRDFFVQHIFGGVDSLGNSYNVQYGKGYFVDRTLGDEYLDAEYFMLPIKGYISGSSSEIDYIYMADWLSTTATAITITLVVVLCCLFVYKIIKLVGNLVK